MNQYTKETRQALANARAGARHLGHKAVGTEHILLGILELNDPLIEGLFASLHTSTVCVTEVLEYVMGRSNKLVTISQL